MVDLTSVTLQLGFLVFEGLLCAVAIALWILWIFVLLWVYRDAESRGMNGAVWFVVAFFLLLVGLIAYLIMRESHPVRGPGAGPPPRGTSPPPGYGPPPKTDGSPSPAHQPPPAQAPPFAGIACKECGSPLPSEAAFCSKCGARR